MSTNITKADAIQRGLRTLWQGIAIDALYAVGAGLGVLLLGGPDVLSTAFWAAAGVLVLKSFLTALASFLQRLKGDPKDIVSPQSVTPSIVTLAAVPVEPDDPETPLFYAVQRDHGA